MTKDRSLQLDYWCMYIVFWDGYRGQLWSKANVCSFNYQGCVDDANQNRRIGPATRLSGSYLPYLLYIPLFIPCYCLPYSAQISVIS